MADVTKDDKTVSSKDLDGMIEEKRKALEALKKEIIDLKTEKYRIENEKNPEEEKKNLTELMEEVRRISLEDCLKLAVTANSSSVKIFDEFKESNKKYLLLNYGDYFEFPILGFFGEISFSGGSDISLVIIKQWKSIGRLSNTITASRLKRFKRVHGQPAELSKEEALAKELQALENVYYEDALNESRSEGLKQEESSSGMRSYPSEHKERFYPFSEPISLGAQTSADREGYGNIYHGEELVREGTKYGATTEFLIIGVYVHGYEAKTV